MSIPALHCLISPDPTVPAALPAEVEKSEFWGALASLAGNGVDRIELVLADRGSASTPGVRTSDAWIDSWAPGCRPAAFDALVTARSAGTARVVLSASAPPAVNSFWDVTLTRIAGRDAVLSVARDATDRIAEEDNLRRVAYRDGLTGLLNRLALRDRLKLEMENASRGGGSVILLMLDLDNFKMINDMLGHDAGDALLVEAAIRLRAAAPDASAVGRLGGDEFAVIAPSPLPRADVFPLAEALIETMRRPVSFNGRVLDTRVSIGVAIFPQHASTASELFKNADIALYAAKSFGRGGFTAYVPSMGSALRKRASSVETVRTAIAEQRLEAFYQPKVDLLTNNVIGFEALLRLRSGDGSVIPAQFIQHAFEDIEIARRIGDQMFDRVAADVGRWRAAGLAVGRIAINASAAEFRAGDFAQRLLEKIRVAELSPELFEIEVAETVLAGRSTDYVSTALADLADAGVRVTLDDFGMGASSLAQLKRLPLSALKIDRTFVNTLESDTGDRAIVRAMIGLADGLGLGMTAVGVETPGQVTELRLLGCSVGQGDLLGSPMPGAEVPAFKAIVSSEPN